MYGNVMVIISLPLLYEPDDFFCKHSLQEKKSKEDNYLEDAVSGGKDEDDFGSDGEENGAAESVDDANAMGEFWVLLPTFLVVCYTRPLTSTSLAFIPLLLSSSLSSCRRGHKEIPL